MIKFLNKELPGHKYFRGTNDIILEWNEPPCIRKRLAALQLKRFVKVLPIIFPIFSAFGLLLFGLKVWSKGHALAVVPWLGLLVVAVVLGAVFCLASLSTIALKRWTPVVVRLASKGIGKWSGGLGEELHCEYEQIQAATMSTHALMPEVRTILLTLQHGKQASLALPESLDLTSVIQILREHGIICGHPDGAAASQLSGVETHPPSPMRIR